MDSNPKRQPRFTFRKVYLNAIESGVDLLAMARKQVEFWEREEAMEHWEFAIECLRFAKEFERLLDQEQPDRDEVIRVCSEFRSYRAKGVGQLFFLHDHLLERVDPITD